MKPLPPPEGLVEGLEGGGGTVSTVSDGECRYCRPDSVDSVGQTVSILSALYFTMSPKGGIVCKAL